MKIEAAKKKAGRKAGKAKKKISRKCGEDPRLPVRAQDRKENNERND